MRQWSAAFERGIHYRFVIAIAVLGVRDPLAFVNASQWRTRRFQVEDFAKYILGTSPRQLACHRYPLVPNWVWERKGKEGSERRRSYQRVPPR